MSIGEVKFILLFLFGILIKEFQIGAQNFQFASLQTM